MTSIFISYSRLDQQYREELKLWLSTQDFEKRVNLITDEKIPPGQARPGTNG